jgi:hypothetical protein
VAESLDGYRFNSTSQFGEDGVLDYLLQAYPNIPRVCLEVGAGNGVLNSNTYSLWNFHGWQALLIERNATRLQHRFGDLPNLTIVETSITPRREQSLDAIASARDFPRDLGVASIDIDSCDYWVLHYLEYLRPAIIVIEFNAQIPAHIDYCDTEDQLFLRHSALAIERLAKVKGYRVVACTGPNAILVSETVIATNPTAVPDRPIAELFDHAYARRFGSVISAQLVTDIPVYASRPTPLLRATGRARYLWRTFRDKWNRRPPKVHAVSPTLRTHVERSGLWL